MFFLAYYINERVNFRVLVKINVFNFLQASEKKVVKVQADDPIAFAQLINKNELGATEV